MLEPHQAPRSRCAVPSTPVYIWRAVTTSASAPLVFGGPQVRRYKDASLRVVASDDEKAAALAAVAAGVVAPTLDPPKAEAPAEAAKEPAGAAN